MESKSILIIPDLHGHYDSLVGLLTKAGELDEDGKRLHKHTVVSVGDLCNAVRSSVNIDRECLEHAKEMLDVLIIGNHELPWYHNGSDCRFSGYWEDGENATIYRRLIREGFVVPAHLVPEHNLLITHAGVGKNPKWQFGTAQEAYDAIMVAWETPPSGLIERNEYPKYDLLYAISLYRGGRSQVGGIMWRDHQEPANKEFSQIYGHTPQPKPQLWTRANGTFTLNIDCGGKSGQGATAAIFDPAIGMIREFIEWSPEPTDEEKEDRGWEL